MKLEQTVSNAAPLGQKSEYPKKYDQSLLFPIARAKQRAAMGVSHDFLGFDMWNAYELFWQNLKGKPVRACASFAIPANSPNICESKSVKLYLNSLNHEQFASPEDVRALIERDLSKFCESPVHVILNPKELSEFFAPDFLVLDDLDISISTYDRDPSLLKTSDEIVHEKLSTHLFKSHCLCTGQPDLGSIFIEYKGPKIIHESLLSYLISYRDHKGFAENCIEQIFVDLKAIGCLELSVFGRFTRRGGIDINPYRSTNEFAFLNPRLIYQ